MVETKPRLVRLDDFLAEGIEAQARGIPPEHPDAEACRRMAKVFRESGRTKMIKVWEEVSQEMSDYKIEPNGTVVEYLTEKATKRGAGARPNIGARFVFKTRHETAEFVRNSESEGSEYEKFQDRIFAEIEGLERGEREHLVESFVEIGQRANIDVVSEILDKGTPVTEVFAAILKALAP